MNSQQIKSLDQTYVAHTYGRFDLALVQGSGATAADAEGNQYIDFLQAGGPTILGSNYPVIREKVIELLNDALLQMPRADGRDIVIAASCDLLRKAADRMDLTGYNLHYNKFEGSDEFRSAIAAHWQKVIFGADSVVVLTKDNVATCAGCTVALETLATLLACIATYKLRNLRFKGLALAASLPPVVFNAVIIGIEIAVLFPDPSSSAPLWLACISNGISVGVGELISCTVLGVLLVKIIESNTALRKVFVEA